MPLSGTPLKVKIIGFAVLAIMVLSLAGISLEAINQSLRDEADSGDVQAQQYQFSVGVAEDPDREGSAAIRAFKFVCPFH
jgi:hypothetical protein